MRGARAKQAARAIIIAAATGALIVVLSAGLGHSVRIADFPQPRTEWLVTSVLTSAASVAAVVYSVLQLIVALLIALLQLAGAPPPWPTPPHTHHTDNRG